LGHITTKTDEFRLTIDFSVIVINQSEFRFLGSLSRRQRLRDRIGYRNTILLVAPETDCGSNREGQYNHQRRAKRPAQHLTEAEIQFKPLHSIRWLRPAFHRGLVAIVNKSRISCVMHS
jgi:hypothetical protein